MRTKLKKFPLLDKRGRQIGWQYFTRGGDLMRTVQFKE